jgi:tetratricopeptide (TPR) repeat protein
VTHEFRDRHRDSLFGVGLLAAFMLLGFAPSPFAGQKTPDQTPAQAQALDKAQADVARARTPQEKAEALVALGRAYFDEGEEQKAYEQYGAALDLDPLNAAAHLERGRLRVVDRDLAAAVNEFRTVIRLAPQAGAGYAALGQLYAESGHPSEARPLLERAVERSPADWPSRYRLALILFDGGQYARARQLLDEVIRLDPGNLDARRQIALDMFRHGDAAGAEAEAESILAKDPSAPAGHLVMALEYWKQRQYEDSLAECALAQQGDPRSVQVIALQALNLWQLDRKKEMRQILTEVSRDPDTRSNFATAGALCRLIICDGKDVGIVGDFLRHNRWVAFPEEP